jgi:hypothetical protein
VALALLPMAALLKWMRRERPFREHVMFLLSFSNCIWLASILTLPVLWKYPGTAALLQQLIGYAYVGVGFFAFYASPTRLRTSGRFAVYVAVDAVMTLFWTYLLMIGVLLTVLLI